MELPAAAGLEYLATNPCEIFTTAKAIPQSLALSTLVTMEMLKALRCVLFLFRFWRFVRVAIRNGTGRGGDRKILFPGWPRGGTAAFCSQLLFDVAAGVWRCLTSGCETLDNDPFFFCLSYLRQPTPRFVPWVLVEFRYDRRFVITRSFFSFTYRHAWKFTDLPC